MTAPSLIEQEYIAGSVKPLEITLPEYTVNPSFCELSYKVIAPLALKEIVTISNDKIVIDGKIKPEKDETFTFKVSALTPTAADDVEASEWSFTLLLTFPKKNSQAEQVLVSGLAGLASTAGLAATASVSSSALSGLGSTASSAVGKIAGGPAKSVSGNTGTSAKS